MANDHAFFALIARMRNIDRWALMRNTSKENIQEHSHMVAVLAHALAVIQIRYYGGMIDPGQVAFFFNDTATTEIYTGDMRASYQEVEDMAANRLLSMLPEELRVEYETLLQPADPEVEALVKAADKLSAYLKCVEELKAGNNEFRLAKEQTYAALAKNPLPALQHFIQHYLPSFELTLDELQG